MSDVPFAQIFRARDSALETVSWLDTQIATMIRASGVGVSISALRILYHLSTHGTSTRSDLRFDTSTTYRLRELERLGFIQTRKKDQDDGRRVGVGITDLGRKAWEKIEAARLKVQEKT